MPTIPADTTDLDKPITKGGIYICPLLSTTNFTEAPGPEGFSLPYYETFTNAIYDPFLEAFNATPGGKPFPRDFLFPYISVFLKRGKNPLSCGSYCTISLLNCSLKIFT